MTVFEDDAEMRARFIPRVLEADPRTLVDDTGENLDPRRIWECAMDVIGGDSLIYEPGYQRRRPTSRARRAAAVPRRARIDILALLHPEALNSQRSLTDNAECGMRNAELTDALRLAARVSIPHSTLRIPN